ncbi:MAG: flagellar biosynthetic protein FliR [Parachlamydiales bacterium]|nr:flagellar biosynthetic protein FliR [Parachlamydiales bacterium]
MNNVVNATDNYFSLLINLPHLSTITILSSFFLTLARLLPIMVLAPFLGSRNLPMAVKMMFSVSLCAIMFPQVLMHVQGEIPFDMAFVGYALKEVLVGLFLGFLAAVPFFIAQSSGSLIDHIRGSSALQVTDPTTNVQTGPMGILYNQVLIVIFFFVGGPFLFINAIGTSYEIIPINGLFHKTFFSSTLPFWQHIIHLLDSVLSMAIQLGAPSIIGILMAEMFLGIANRLAPQVQIVFLGISLKSWVGLALLAAAWYFVLTQLGKESLNWVKMIEKTILEMAPS